MQAVIKKWGNSAAVRIPAAVMQAIRLQLDQTVDVRVTEETAHRRQAPINRRGRQIALFEADAE